VFWDSPQFIFYVCHASHEIQSFGVAVNQVGASTWIELLRNTTFKFPALVIKLDYALFEPMAMIVLDKYDNYNNLFDGNDKDLSQHITLVGDFLVNLE